MRGFQRFSLAALIALGALNLGAVREDPRPESIVPVVDEAPTNAKDYNWLSRHERVLERNRKGKVDLILIGDSITHMWGGDPSDPEKGPGPVQLWKRYFEPRNTVNMGFGWDRTEHVLWRLENGELDHIRPKVAVVQIGTNNLWKHSPDDIALGIRTIVQTVRRKLPRTKILLLGLFPRDREPNTFNRQRMAEVNAKIATIRERNVTYLDISQQFLQPDGTISPEVMPDYLHLSEKGFQIWGEAMEPVLCRMFGDKDRSIRAESTVSGR